MFLSWLIYVRLLSRNSYDLSIFCLYSSMVWSFSKSWSLYFSTFSCSFFTRTVLLETQVSWCFWVYSLCTCCRSSSILMSSMFCCRVAVYSEYLAHCPQLIWSMEDWNNLSFMYLVSLVLIRFFSSWICSCIYCCLPNSSMFWSISCWLDWKLWYIFWSWEEDSLLFSCSLLHSSCN